MCIARTREDVEAFVEHNRDAFGIVLLGYNHVTRFLYRAFKRFDVRYAQYESVRTPITPITRPFSFEGAALLERVRKRHYAAAANQLFRKFRSVASKARLVASDQIPARLKGVQPPRFSLRSTRNYIRISPPPARDTEAVWIHHLDYDLYLELRDNPLPQPPEPYCVFLDEYFTLHPDFRVFGATAPEMDTQRYYEGLNRFFDVVERRLKMRVIIAAHPRARYDLNPELFPRRKMEQFKTAELVSRATLVLAHESTSINFAVMFRKPVVFLTSDEIEKTRYGESIRNCAATLGKVPINVDRDIECSDLEREWAVDDERYQEFFVNYIKIRGTPERPYWEIVADPIESEVRKHARF
ncbi:MAG: hypothetical protein IH968_13630 [Gemmatimonadetes bacterium]|nr:hypothetical protein [Gemmatimonadota bacterium]